ncbi:MAG: TIR domain-containing protein [Candidatus Coatesbacteria bacterium]|nr:TIR domain-containing protein [Candidatus Coatesbacteria bacterium]
MATKVFISWSGDLSRKLGEALSGWLPATLRYVKPYFSPDDVEKGAMWYSEVAKELESSNVGIICLTQENAQAPWILFEAGALSKYLEKARVCTLLFDLDAADVKGPLTSFQATKFAREDFKRLVGTINNTAGDAKLEPTVLDSVFDKWWPDLENQVAEIIRTYDGGTKRQLRPERDILGELLDLTRKSAERAHNPSMNSAEVTDLLMDIKELVYLSALQDVERAAEERHGSRVSVSAQIRELNRVWERTLQKHGKPILSPSDEAVPETREVPAEQELGGDTGKPGSAR